MSYPSGIVIPGKINFHLYEFKDWKKCCRDLGKAVERWRARLAVSQDAGRDQSPEQDSAGGGKDEQPQDAPGEDEDMPAGGEYEFVNAGEQRQAGGVHAPAGLSRLLPELTRNYLVAEYCH